MRSRVDDSICNPGRVMRLAGSLAWATKEGRQLELTSRAILRQPGQPMYMAEQLERAFPVVQQEVSASQADRNDNK